MKYQRFTPTGCENIRIIKFEFVTKTNLLSQLTFWNQVNIFDKDRKPCRNSIDELVSGRLTKRIKVWTDIKYTSFYHCPTLWVDDATS